MTLHMKRKTFMNKLNLKKYRPVQPNLDFQCTYAFIKNLHFLPNDYETRSKSSTYEYLILTEFRNHTVKIVDSLRGEC